MPCAHAPLYPAYRRKRIEEFLIATEPYDATKAGMLAMTRTLAFEEAAHGVRANAICPGSTLTDFHVNRAQAAGKSVDVLKTQRQDTSFLERWASPEEVAWPILWLASDEASFITGTTLMVDGGLSIM
jgi:meso-butanediol dehydrogenase/(S,S)-butanediol dehydrogenase/diacetyl reductase